MAAQGGLDALTVEIAPRDQLVNANTLYGLADSATRIAGPALGGVLVALAGAAVLVAADAASYAVSVLALSLLRLPRAPAGMAGTAAQAGQAAGLAGADGTEPAARPTLRADLAEGWADFRSRTWLCASTVQFAFFNLITWAPWMLLGPVLGRAYLGGAGIWGAIMAVQGAGAITAGLLCLGRRPLARSNSSAKAGTRGPAACGGITAACGPRLAERRRRPAARPR
jgi:hypothetical protein